MAVIQIPFLLRLHLYKGGAAEKGDQLQKALPGRVDMGFALLPDSGKPCLHQPLRYCIDRRCSGGVGGVKNQVATAHKGIRAVFSRKGKITSQQLGTQSAVGLNGRSVSRHKHNLMKRLLILLVKGYSYLVSPFLGNNCRYYPTLLRVCPGGD